jgi:hypothetical protein
VLTMNDEIKLQFCSKCRCTKVQEKYFTINKKGQYLKTCIKCREKAKQYREENKEEIKQYEKLYRADKRHHCEHNRIKRSCRICDPNGHLRSIVSGRIKTALKSDKTEISIQYLGCTIAEFKVHIENQFTEGMTWENHGTWHIDHIIPIKYKKDDQVPTLEDTIERLKWTNTQPLWAYENIAKGNRYIG